MLLLKHDAESTNPEASTEAQNCKQRHDYTFLTNKLPKQIHYRDDVYEKTSSYKFNERPHTGSGYLNGS